MSIWSRISDALTALRQGQGLAAVFETLRTPPERTVGFTIAVIALSAKMAKAAELAASSRAERVDKVRDHLQRVDDAVKLAKKLDANSPAKRWATIMAKADAPSAPAAKSERLPPLAVAVAVVAAAYVVRALFAKE